MRDIGVFERGGTGGRVFEGSEVDGVKRRP